MGQVETQIICTGYEEPNWLGAYKLKVAASTVDRVNRKLFKPMFHSFKATVTYGR